MAIVKFVFEVITICSQQTIFGDFNELVVTGVVSAIMGPLCIQQRNSGYDRWRAVPETIIHLLQVYCRNHIFQVIFWVYQRAAFLSATETKSEVQTMENRGKCADGSGDPASRHTASLLYDPRRYRMDHQFRRNSGRLVFVFFSRQFTPRLCSALLRKNESSA